MKARKKSKPARKSASPRKARRVISARSKAGKAGKAGKVAQARRRARPKMRSSAAATSGSPYAGAIRGIQEAAASLTDDELIAIISDLPWPSRAKWLSSYLADQIPEELQSDGDALADAIDDVGAEIAALLTVMDAEQPTDYLHAVTCCFSAEPSHVEAGSAWLKENTGERTIDLGALTDLPGYRAVAQLIERARRSQRA